MTPKEKSLSLVEDLIYKCKECDAESNAITSAIYVVNEIQSALYNYLKDTDELQNADREFAYWNEVEKEIEKL